MVDDHSTKPKLFAKNSADLTGQTFGRYTVTAFSGRNGHGAYMWECSCVCGNRRTVVGSELRCGRQKSCGCLAAELSANRLRTHGLSRTDLYKIWERIVSRCCDPANTMFCYYGDRGICICTGWRDSVQTFVTDMGERPSRKYSVNRKDNDGHYSCGHCKECLANGWPANCEWATDTEQARNSRRNHLITIADRTQCLSAWCEELGVKPWLFHGRIKRGWPVQEALLLPSDSARKLHQRISTTR